MKRSTLIFIGVVVLLVVAVISFALILDNQKKIMQSQRVILDNMKEKSIQMITGNPTKTIEKKRNPVGYDTPSKLANC